MNETRNDACTLLGLRNLRVELHTVNPACVVSDGRTGLFFGHTHLGKPLRHLRDGVTMVHHDLEDSAALLVHRVLDAVEQSAWRRDSHTLNAEFTVRS